MTRRIRLMGRLASIAAEGLEQTGVTWADLSEIEERSRRIVVPLPPLFSDLQLGKDDLSRYLAVEIPVALEDFVAAYETFVATYFQVPGRKPNPERDIRRALQLGSRDSQMLFGRIGPGRPSARMRDHALLTVSFAAVAHYNFGAQLTNGPHSCFATLGDWRFGIERNAIVTNYGQKSIELDQLLFHPQGLWRLTRAPGASIRKPDTLALLWAWLSRPSTAKNYPEREALQLALQILFWRGGARQHTALRAAIRDVAGPESWARALKMADGFMSFEDPYKGMHNIFVPNLLTKREFVKVFGERPRRAGTPNQQRQRLWRMSLDYLKTKRTGEIL